MDELSLTAYFSFLKDNIVFRTADLGGPLPAGAIIPITVRGKQAIHATELITTSDEVLPKGDIGKIGFCYFHNKSQVKAESQPAAPVVSPFGAAGTSKWGYKVVVNLSDGSVTEASLEGVTLLGNATIDGTNYNILTGSGYPAALSYDFYRLEVGTSPVTLGKIGTFTPDIIGAGYAFHDTGLAGDASTPPVDPAPNIIELGSDGTLYDNALKSTEESVARWNAAAIHAKASAGPIQFEYILIED